MTRSSPQWARVSSSLHGVLVIRLLWVMVLLSCGRVVFYLFNRDLLADLSLEQFLYAAWGGLQFDLSALMYTNGGYALLYLWPSRIRYRPIFHQWMDGVFIATNGVALAANAVDWTFYRFTLKRTTARVVEEFEGVGNSPLLAGRLLLSFWPATIVGILFLLLLYVGVRRLSMPCSFPARTPLQFCGRGVLATVLGVSIVVCGARGSMGVRLRPINNASAGRFVDKPGHLALVLNTPFSIYRTLNKSGLKAVNTFAGPERLAQIYTPFQAFAQQMSPEAAHRNSGSSRPAANIVLLILESFGADVVGALRAVPAETEPVDYTPFLSRLAQRSLVFPNAFANGKSSVDALPAILAGLPSLGQSYVLSPYGQNRIVGLGTLLKTLGYQTAFFHGGRNGTMGFDSFVKLAGMDAYYGMDEYDNDADFDGSWGIWDEPFLQFMAAELSTLESPFFAGVFTLSSHSPFTVPAEHRGKFLKGPYGVHETIGYADHALAQFFERAAGEPWYDNTLFVITADHRGPSGEGAYNTPQGHFRVPLFFFHPGSDNFVGRDERVVQHCDIMPTLARYAGYREALVAFGGDIFSRRMPRFAVGYFGGAYQLTMGSHFLVSDGQKPIGFFDTTNDILLRQNLVTEHPARLRPMHRLLQAIVQQYNTRMRNNLLTIQ